MSRFFNSKGHLFLSRHRRQKRATWEPLLFLFSGVISCWSVPSLSSPSLSSYSREKKNDSVLWSQDVKFTRTVGSQTGRDAVDRERRWGKKMTQRRRKKKRSPYVTIGSEGGQEIHEMFWFHLSLQSLGSKRYSDTLNTHRHTQARHLWAVGAFRLFLETFLSSISSAVMSQPTQRSRRRRRKTLTSTSHTNSDTYCV